MGYNIKPFRGIQLNRTHPLARGLVACWVMNEGTGNTAYDLSGNRNHASMLNFSTYGWQARGIWYRDSADHIIVSDKNQFEGWPEYSFICIANRDGTLQSGNSRIFDKNGGVVACGFSPTTFSIWQGSWYDTAYVMPINTNIGITATFIGGTLKKYINAQLVDTDIGVSNPGTGSGSLYIGNQNAEDADFWPGFLNLFYIYNRALTVSEVELLYRDPYAMFEAQSPGRFIFVPAAAEGNRVPIIDHHNRMMAMMGD